MFNSANEKNDGSAAAPEPSAARSGRQPRPSPCLGVCAAGLAEWDEALLLQELQALLAEDFDLGLIGIPEDELDALLADADDRPAISDDAADAIPEPPVKSITRPGDIWALGKHRLCCGDATDPAAVAS